MKKRIEYTEIEGVIELQNAIAGCQINSKAMTPIYLLNGTKKIKIDGLIYDGTEVLFVPDFLTIVDSDDDEDVSRETHDLEEPF